MYCIGKPLATPLLTLKLLPLVVEQDIYRFEVEMDHAACMRIGPPCVGVPARCLIAEHGRSVGYASQPVVAWIPLLPSLRYWSYGLSGVPGWMS